jgi:hypothetical protein
MPWVMNHFLERSLENKITGLIEQKVQINYTPTRSKILLK